MRYWMASLFKLRANCESSLSEGYLLKRAFRELTYVANTTLVIKDT